MKLKNSHDYDLSPNFTNILGFLVSFIVLFRCSIYFSSKMVTRCECTFISDLEGGGGGSIILQLIPKCWGKKKELNLSKLYYKISFI